MEPEDTLSFITLDMIDIEESYLWSIFRRVSFEKVISSDHCGSHQTLCPLSAGDKIASCHTRKKYEVTDLGIMHPEEIPTTSLHPGQVGYISCNMKESAEGNDKPCVSLKFDLCMTSSHRRYPLPCG